MTERCTIVMLALCGLGFAVGGALIYIGLQPPREAPPPPVVESAPCPPPTLPPPHTPGATLDDNCELLAEVDLTRILDQPFRTTGVPIHAAPTEVGTLSWKGDVMYFEGDVEATAQSIYHSFGGGSRHVERPPFARFSISDGVEMWTARFETTDEPLTMYTGKWDDSAKAVIHALLRLRAEYEKAEAKP